MNAGWIVEVEAEAGPLLFAARTAHPEEAEKIVRRLFDIADDHDVIAVRPVDGDTLRRLKVGDGEARGPM